MTTYDRLSGALRVECDRLLDTEPGSRPSGPLILIQTYSLALLAMTLAGATDDIGRINAVTTEAK